MTASDTRLYDRAGLLGAGVTLACAVVFQVLAATHPGVHLQPTDLPLPAADFLRPIATEPGAMLLWMAFDCLFVLGYTAMFTGAYGLARSRLLGGLSLGGILVAGALDAVENALLAGYAAQSELGAVVQAPPLTALYTVAALKTAAAMFAVAFLGLALPSATRLQRAMGLAAAAFVLVNAAGVAVPELGPVEALPIAVLTVLLGVTFRARLRDRGNARGKARGAESDGPRPVAAGGAA